jgi:hypothetical protein
MSLGIPHIDTKINLIMDIIIFFIISMIISITVITIFKKWDKISFITVIKSNLILYSTLISIFIFSFSLGIYTLNFSPKNDFIEKLLYVLFFLFVFFIQSILILKCFNKKANNTFSKRYKFLILILYLFSLTYIIINYFPEDAYDKYLTYTKTYVYLPTQKTKILLDNYKLKIDSANSEIDYFSNKKNIEEDLMFTIYFDSPHIESVPFSFKVLDSINSFGGSSSQTKYKELYIRKLKDSIKIILEEVNFNKNIYWNNPKNTDTILFLKTKTRIKKNK